MLHSVSDIQVCRTYEKSAALVLATAEEPGYEGDMQQHPLLPEGEALRRAVRWLAEHEKKTQKLIEEACQRFDLSPADEDFLMRHFLGDESE